MEAQGHDVDALLERVMQQARQAGIPIAGTIAPHVTVNTRAKRRFGQCIIKGNTYTIELSAMLLNAPEEACCQTLAHELIHTCRGCRNHGRLFRQYAAVMNHRYGYHIRCTNSPEEMGLADKASAEARYILQCRQCGKEYGYYRCGKAVKNPSGYACRCGGTLRRIR